MTRTAFAFSAFGVLAACGGVPADHGGDALLHVSGGEFRRGSVHEDGGSPRVLAAFLTQTTFRVGEQDKSFSGVLEAGATAALVALEGDAGYFIVPAGFPPPEAPDSPSFDAPLSFSERVGPGPHALWVWAADASSRVGPRTDVAFTLVAQPVPNGELVVSLSWDTESDLDLHLVLPDGTEVYRDNTNSYQPSAGSGASDAFRSGGILDFDSNAECVIDGRRNENVVWTEPPPSGPYVVRVDAFSLCGASSAHFRVEVRFMGNLIANAEGTLLPSSTRFEHGRGAGVRALDFDVP